MSNLTCPNCGGQISANAKFCTNCGSKIPTCPNCGAPVSATAKFCTACGCKLEACPKCNAPIKAGAKFCTVCGQKIVEEPVVVPPVVEEVAPVVEEEAPVVEEVAPVVAPQPVEIKEEADIPAPVVEQKVEEIVVVPQPVYTQPKEDIVSVGNKAIEACKGINLLNVFGSITLVIGLCILFFVLYKSTSFYGYGTGAYYEMTLFLAKMPMYVAIATVLEIIAYILTSLGNFLYPKKIYAYVKNNGYDYKTLLDAYLSKDFSQMMPSDIAKNKKIVFIMLNSLARSESQKGKSIAILIISLIINITQAIILNLVLTGLAYALELAGAVSVMNLIFKLPLFFVWLFFALAGSIVVACFNGSIKNSIPVWVSTNLPDKANIYNFYAKK